jgi:oligopeptide transport system substrate-binding protein
MSGWKSSGESALWAGCPHPARDNCGLSAPRPHQRRLLLRLLVLLPALAWPACVKQDAPPPAASQILRLSQRNEPADLDPATATLPDEFFIIRALSEGLVRPSPAGGQQPAGAEHWDISEDGRTYTFHLRPNARWSNDEPVTAEDFVASYRRVLAPATAARKTSLFFAVKNARAFATGELADFNSVGFRAADAHTLVITLERPMPAFLAYVASGPWIPVNPRVVAQFGRDWTRPEHFVGNGPFVLTEWRPHQRIVVRKNPRYADATRIRLDEIQFIALDNGEAEERAYRAGQVDVTMAVPASKLATYARERPAELHRLPLAETRTLAFNTQHRPLDDVRVRRALSLAIDRQGIVDHVLLGSQQPAGLLVPPALRPPESRSTEPAKEPLFAPDEARRLLAEAGFPQGKNFPRLELSGWTNQPVLEAIQAMWRRELGIEVAIATREAKVHVAALRSGDYDIGFFISSPDVADPANLLAEFTTGASGNYAHWSDERYDQRMAAAARSTDAHDAAQRLREAEALLSERCPVAPLYYNTQNWLMNTRVQGWQQDALWTRSYHDIYLKEN